MKEKKPYYFDGEINISYIDTSVQIMCYLHAACFIISLEITDDIF